MHGFPKAAPGMRVGLLGGSFDPAHAGHLHISRWALRRLRLDRVWWLVSPGNPLKSRAPAALDARMARARAVAAHPRLVVTDVEARLGLRYTAETLAALRRLYPSVRFVWLMGADNLAQLHHWDRWREIAETTPMGVLARPGEQVRAGLSPAARTYAAHRRRPARAAGLAMAAAPAWAMLTGPMSDLSSTALRRSGDWPRAGR